MTSNPWLMQMQADIFGKIIEVRQLDTCWGVAKGVLASAKLNTNIKSSASKIYHPNL